MKASRVCVCPILNKLSRNRAYANKPFIRCQLGATSNSLFAIQCAVQQHRALNDSRATRGLGILRASIRLQFPAT